MKNFNSLLEKGITIIGLIVTIVIILIVAGIAIAKNINDGIMKKTSLIIDENQKVSDIENLRIPMSSLIINKGGKEVSIEEYIDYLDKNKIIEKDEVEYEEGRACITLEDGYIYEVGIENGNLMVEFVGNAGKIAPKINISLKTTTSEIAVIPIVRRNTGGKVKFYIKEEGETEYKEGGETSNTEYKFSKLKQNKKYYIKAVATSRNGLTAETEEIGETSSVSTPTSADLSSTSTWSTTEPKVTVTFTTTSGLTIETSIDDGTTWKAENPITVNSGTQIYARYSDGTNQGTRYAALKPVLTYTVAYNANNGTGTTANSTHTYGVSRKLTKNGFTRSYCNFLGWSTNASAKTASYTDEQSVGNLTTINGKTINLYAIWKDTTPPEIRLQGGTLSQVTISATDSQSTITGYVLKAASSQPANPAESEFTSWNGSSKALSVSNNQRNYLFVRNDDGLISSKGFEIHQHTGSTPSTSANGCYTVQASAVGEQFSTKTLYQYTFKTVPTLVTATTSSYAGAYQGVYYSSQSTSSTKNYFPKTPQFKVKNNSSTTYKNYYFVSTSSSTSYSTAKTTSKNAFKSKSVGYNLPSTYYYSFTAISSSYYKTRTVYKKYYEYSGYYYNYNLGCNRSNGELILY